MIPRTLSASSMNVSMLCLKRWETEYLNRLRGPSNDAADNGTAVHAALDTYVKDVYQEDVAKPDLMYLLVLYKAAFMDVFKSDADGPVYAEGVDMLKRWFKEESHYISEGTVISREQKKTFDLNTSVGKIPFTYIIDRLDLLDDGTFRVVDYKTIRVPITADDLKDKIQPRAYALAVQIEHPEAKRIIVEFDMIRHGRVGMVFNREDNIKTWTMLKREAKRIIEAGDDPKATVNHECIYCPIKHNCEELQKNINAGTTVTLPALSQDELAGRLYALKGAAAALDTMINDVDAAILEHAQNEDQLEWKTHNWEVTVGVSRRRSIDAERVSDVIGPDLMTKYGNLTMKSIDTLLKGDEINEMQKGVLKSYINYVYGDPKAKVKPLGISKKET